LEHILEFLYVVDENLATKMDSLIDFLILELYFYDVFYQDNVYPAKKRILAALVQKKLIDIDLSSWITRYGELKLQQTDNTGKNGIIKIQNQIFPEISKNLTAIFADCDVTSIISKICSHTYYLILNG
jgi:hypothetical protein